MAASSLVRVSFTGLRGAEHYEGQQYAVVSRSVAQQLASLHSADAQMRLLEGSAQLWQADRPTAKAAALVAAVCAERQQQAVQRAERGRQVAGRVDTFVIPHRS
jgi:hypothetical protein